MLKYITACLLYTCGNLITLKILGFLTLNPFWVVWLHIAGMMH